MASSKARAKLRQGRQEKNRALLSEKFRRVPIKDLHQEERCLVIHGRPLQRLPEKPKTEKK